MDDRLAALLPDGGLLELLHDGGTFTEGPVWFADLQCLLWSDIPANRILRWTPDGQVGTFRADSRNANGNTRDRQGRLVTCEHSGRRVTRTEPDGRITVIADHFEGRRLNSPNDVVVRSDGTIWFTDPEYGLRASFPGLAREQQRENVFRVDPATSAITAVISDFDKPNGLAFSPDERVLYVADSAVSHDPAGNSHIRRFRVEADGTVAGGEVFAVTAGIPDGMRVDVAGNLWASAGARIDVYDPSGTLLGAVGGFPADVTNLAFGGPGGDRIFVTGGRFLFSVKVAIRGALGVCALFSTGPICTRGPRAVPTMQFDLISN
jgi:gluconolactonase